MVNYMWGKDVADALQLREPVKVGRVEFSILPADPNDEYDFTVSAAGIERALQHRRDRLDNPQTTR